MEVYASEVGVVRFADGRMAEFWGVLDEPRLRRQLTSPFPLVATR